MGGLPPEATVDRPGAGPGGFDAALRAAITDSGLSLDELSQRLRRRRTPVSASTLSYWQNGENQPERASSLAAVPVLEELLGLPPGTLLRLVGPRRSRQRRPGGVGRSVGFDEVWGRPETYVRALTKIDATPEDLNHPFPVSQHLSSRIDAAGHEESVRVRRIMLADRETHRFLFVSRCHNLSRPPMVTYADGCRLNRFRADVFTATCVFEFTLDAPLRAGDAVAVEFALRFPPGQETRHALVALSRPARSLVIDVAFAPERLPTRYWGFRRSRSTATPEDTELLLTPTRKLQFVTLDPGPGQYGIEWRWDRTHNTLRTPRRQPPTPRAA
ncbi:hypothetical protein GCM10010123_41930 [Pilimelia anulata]|uniref:Uncharacterized protein n=1 Tax=Pilimelia anulata TaxID=53371 RepID=A0A8J3BDV8_9ACTN|nr:hypothetical protein [Pilimelia anulata]GGK07565.1 hypothetical protein GCM10010123_41930 [Pilimelia anulata]